MRKDERACVDVTEGKVERGRGKRGRGEGHSQGFTRCGGSSGDGRFRCPREELCSKVGGTGDENEAVRREYGGGMFWIGGGKSACEGDANVRVETGTPHVDKVFAELVDAVLLCVALFA